MFRLLAKQTAIYGVSSIVARLLNYLLMPFLTRIMTPAEYGVVGDMYAVIPFALVVLTFGMETSYFKFAGTAKNHQEKLRVFSTAWGSVTLVALLFFALVMLFLEPIASVMDYSSHKSYVAIVGAIIALDVITAVPFARLRERAQAGRFVVVRVFSVVINVLLCLFFYGLLPRLTGFWTQIYDPGFGAGYVFVANLIASLFTLIVLLPSCDGGLKIHWRRLGVMLIYSLPLLLSGIAGTANEFIDRQMIKYLMPGDVAMSSLGIYSAVVKIGVVLLLFTQMYRMAAEPFFLSGFDKKDFVKTNAVALKYFLIVSIVLFLGISLFSDLFALLVGEDFRQGMDILPVILLSNIFSGVVLNLSFWYKQTGATKYAFYVTGIGLVFTLVLNIILIPTFGYMGAALARLACESVMVVVSYYLNRKYYPTPYDIRRIAEYFAVGTLIYIIGLYSALLSEVLKYFVNLLLVLCFGIYALKREKINLIKLIKK
ncbi:MAG: polysaccharide biosynthesis C-terminal domain-containing protein [Rikenellaceae bacterium]